MDEQGSGTSPGRLIVVVREGSHLSPLYHLLITSKCPKERQPSFYSCSSHACSVQWLDWILVMGSCESEGLASRLAAWVMGRVQGCGGRTSISCGLSNSGPACETSQAEVSINMQGLQGTRARHQPEVCQQVPWESAVWLSGDGKEGGVIEAFLFKYSPVVNKYQRQRVKTSPDKCFQCRSVHQSGASTGTHPRSNSVGGPLLRTRFGTSA